jgi:hypothetical protein
MWEEEELWCGCESVEFIPEEKVCFLLILSFSFALFFLSDIRGCVRMDGRRGFHVDLVGLDGAERRGVIILLFRVATKGRHTIFLLRVVFVLALIWSLVLGNDGMGCDERRVAFEIHNNR